MEGLGIDLGVFVSQVVNFALLLLLLYVLLFKRVVKMLDERKAKIEQGLEMAERAQAEVSRAETVYQERMQQVEHERDAIIAQAREEAQRLKAEAAAQAKEEAREEGRRVLAQEREAFEAERQQALADMHNQIVSLVLAATSKVVEEGIDEKMQRRLIDSFLSEAGVLGEVQ